jgi:uncharacterized membrane protein YfcA
MRGGALPLLAWALLLALSGMLNAIWTGDTIQSATFGAAVLAILVVVAGLTLRSRESIRRGEPSPRTRAEAIPRASTSVVVMAVGLAALLFGLTFGHFPIYLGAAMILAGLGRLMLELRAQRHAVRAASEEAAPEQL